MGGSCGGIEEGCLKGGAFAGGMGEVVCSGSCY